MLFTISGRHLEITDAIRSYAEEKTSKLPRYYNSITSVEVDFETEALQRMVPWVVNSL